MAEDMIPKARLDAEIAKRVRAEDALKKLEATIAEGTGSADKQIADLTAERDAAVKALQSERQDWEINSALISEGITEDGVQYLRYRYDQHQPEEGEDKPAFGDWFNGFKEGNATTVNAFRNKPQTEAHKEDATPEDNGSGWAWQRQPQAKPKSDPTATNRTQPDDPPAAVSAEDLANMDKGSFMRTLGQMGWVEQPDS